MITLLSVVFGLLSMVAYGMVNAYSKPLSQQLGPAQFIYLRGFALILILTVVATPSYYLLGHWQVALATLGLGLAGYLPVLAFTHGVKTSPLGVIAPIAGASPLITVLLSVIFLNIGLHAMQWAAVVSVVLANVAVSVNLKAWRQSHFLHASSGVPFALAAMLGWGLFYFWLVPATRVLGPWLAALLVEVGVTLAAALHIKLSGQKVLWAAAWSPKVVLSGVLIGIGTLAFTVGINYFNVGIVAALANSTALITTLLGVYLFHEHLHAKERLAGAIMIIGIAVLSVF